jgi:hypothetical protein
MCTQKMEGKWRRERSKEWEEWKKIEGIGQLTENVVSKKSKEEKHNGKGIHGFIFLNMNGLPFLILNNQYPSCTLRILTFSLLCQLLCYSYRQKWRIPYLILFEWWFFRTGRSGKENLTHASWNQLYFLTLWIRQPVIGPPFPTILIVFRVWGGHGPLVPLWQTQTHHSLEKQLG